MSDTSTSEPNDAPAGDDPPLYLVTTAYDLPELRLPRRPGHGSRGVLLVDRPAGQVYLLDADDDAHTFAVRDVRPLAGDPTDLNPPRDGRDHVVRAALETDYDVMAAPWVDAPEQPEQVIE